MKHEQAIAAFQAAREHYLAHRFTEATGAIQRYRQTVDYRLFEQAGRRRSPDPQISVIVVSYRTNGPLLECLASVFQQEGSRFEVILIDNGGNEAVHPELAKLPLLWIKPPVNLLPSEGRNVGAHFARGEHLMFLDDDALMAPGYLAEACRAMKDESIVALRGRVLPKIESAHAHQAQHYDLGDEACPAELNLEGNCVIRRAAYAALRGFDPLLFGHEGKELTRRIHGMFPTLKILYWPSLLIRHDYAHTERLAAKRERQALAKDYMQYLKERHLHEGISILVRAGDNLAAADEFLASLVKHNTYKPVEVLLWANDSPKALITSHPYLGKLFVRVLPAGTKSLHRVGQQARYDNMLVVDLPVKITNDVLLGWLQRQQTDLSSTLLCSKQQLTKLADAAPTLALTKMASKLGKPAPQTVPKSTGQPHKPATKAAQQAQQSPQPEKLKAKPAAAPNKPQSKLQPKSEFAQKIRQTEEQIQQIEAQLAQADGDIATLESHYLPQPEHAPEKQALKDQLEDKVLTSCRLLIDLKDAQDNLQELRIRSICGA